MPAIPLILSGIQAAITLAPGAIQIVESAKAMIEGLFRAGAISAEDQDRLFAHVDAVAAAALAGEVPPAWQVQADPGSPA